MLAATTDSVYPTIGTAADTTLATQPTARARRLAGADGNRRRDMFAVLMPQARGVLDPYLL